MNCGKCAFLVSLILIALALPYPPLQAGSHEEHQHNMKAGEPAGAGQATDFVSMPAPGKKVPVGNGEYLIYGFDKKPKMGTVIMKVQVFDGRGEKDTSLTITADAGMPLMASAHGEHCIFKLSNKGDYLAPVNIMMPGDWEMKFTVMKDGKVIFRGSYKFDV
jgi:hypothetical protein